MGGVLDVPGATMLEKARHLEEHGDELRRLMLREPRGYPALCANVILPPTHPDADAGYVIMEHVEYPGMSGTNTICVATALLETGMLPMTEPVTEITLEAPAGLIRIRATCAGGKVTGVTFRNVPAFATHLDTPIEVPQLGTVVVDVAYGGMFYVIADAEALGFRLVPDEGRDITRVTEMIKAAAAEQLPVVHPEQPGFAGITIGQLSGPAARPAGTRGATWSRSRPGTLDWSRPSTWTGVIDRSPCGTGTCAKMAVLHAKGRLAAGRGLPPRGDPRDGVHRAARRGDAGRGADRGRARRSPGRRGSPGSRRTWWTRRTRSRRGTRSATSGRSSSQRRRRTRRRDCR